LPIRQPTSIGKGKTGKMSVQPEEPSGLSHPRADDSPRQKVAAKAQAGIVDAVAKSPAHMGFHRHI
jgi:hypothetical protein